MFNLKQFASFKALSPSVRKYVEDSEIELSENGFDQVLFMEDFIIVYKSLDNTNHARIEIVFSTSDVSSRIVFESIESFERYKNSDEIKKSYEWAEYFCQKMKCNIIKDFLGINFKEGVYYVLKDESLNEVFVAQYMGQKNSECINCHKEGYLYTFNLYDKDGSYETFSYDKKHLPKVLTTASRPLTVDGKPYFITREGKFLPKN